MSKRSRAALEGGGAELPPPAALGYGAGRPGRHPPRPPRKLNSDEIQRQSWWLLCPATYVDEGEKDEEEEEEEELNDKEMRAQALEEIVQKIETLQANGGVRRIIEEPEQKEAMAPQPQVKRRTSGVLDDLWPARYNWGKESVPDDLQLLREVPVRDAFPEGSAQKYLPLLPRQPIPAEGRPEFTVIPSLAAFAPPLPFQLEPLDAPFLHSLAGCVQAGVFVPAIFPSEDESTLRIYILKSRFDDLEGSTERDSLIPRIRHVMSWAFPNAPFASASPVPRDFNPSTLYAAIAPSMRDRMAAISDEHAARAQHPALLTRLRQYQRRAVSWMLEREAGKANGDALERELRAYWKKLAIPGDSSVYYNEFTGKFSLSYPELHRYEVNGGVLAEEMGLGKTLEVLTLVLSHPWAAPDDRSLPPTIKAEDTPTQERPRKRARLDEEDASVDVEEQGASGEGQDDEQVGDEVKCYCGGLVSDAEPCVFCESCRTWQHMQCVGFDEDVEGNDVYICPECSEDQEETPIKATLIVCPDAILHQWADECAKHIQPDTLRIAVYEGVRDWAETRPRGVRLCRPSQLARYDLIVTTYATLTRDLSHTDNLKARASPSKKYRYVPTPLRQVVWWRLCMDESQLFGGGSSGAAQMLSQLAANNRWAVSGTPVQRGMPDLFGMLLFLGIGPYDDKAWWQRALETPYLNGSEGASVRLTSLLSRIMWRNTKASVALELPPQTQHSITLEFSEVERFLYKKRHEAVSEEAAHLVAHYAERRVPEGKMKKALESLLRLRQLCCHPQFGQHTGFQSLQAATMTMEELLEQLVVKARIECEDHQRAAIFAQHALAGLHIVRAQPGDAIALYEDVLRDKETRVDLLQRIHATHNLLDAFRLQRLKEEAPAEPEDAMDLEDPVPPPPRAPVPRPSSERLEELTKSEGEMKRKFLQERLVPISVNRAVLDETNGKLQELKVPDWLDGSPWWFTLIGALQDVGDERVVQLIKRDLFDRQQQYSHKAHLTTVADRFRDLSGLQIIIFNELQKLLRARQAALDAVRGTCQAELHPESVVRQVLSCKRCKLRPDSEVLCPVCKVEERVDAYEDTLYLTRDSSHEKLDNRHEAEFELILRALQSYLGRSDSALPQAQLAGWKAEAAAQHRAIEAMKRELTTLRETATNTRYLAFGQDELQMCTDRIRLRLRQEGEQVDEKQQGFIIRPFEIGTLLRKYQTDLTIALGELRHGLSQLHYLEGLAQRSRQPHAIPEAAECPICHEPFGAEVVVWTCGHELCPPCMLQLLKHHTHGTVPCPSCRTRMNVNEASRVLRGSRLDPTVSKRVEGEEKAKERKREVKGSWGTKIEAVVVRILEILEDDPRAKILLFSQWNDILLILGRALTDNAIGHLELQGDKKRTAKVLTKFRTDPKVPVLLLSLHRGANGLNLTEANHVFLVEPSLNPAAEAQAIGRVHRIGQSKPTFVHRFIVKSTVEEKVFRLGQAKGETDALVAGFGARQREEDMLGLKDLDEIVNDGKGLAKQAEQQQSAELEAQQLEDLRYWQTRVLCNGRPLERFHALAILTRNLTLGRAQGEAPQELVEWKGRRIAPEVKEGLLALPIAPLALSPDEHED